MEPVNKSPIRGCMNELGLGVDKVWDLQACKLQEKNELLRFKIIFFPHHPKKKKTKEVQNTPQSFLDYMTMYKRICEIFNSQGAS